MWKKRGYTMTKKIYRRPAGSGLTPKETAMLEEAGKFPLVYDNDCPKMTPEQLEQFKPVHYNTMEERARAMKTAGITGPEEAPAPRPAREEVVTA
jgi:hypothetical protein